LLIVSAKNKNITLQTVGAESFVNINGENLVNLVAKVKKNRNEFETIIKVGFIIKAKQAVQQVNEIQDNYVTSLQTQMQSLTTDISGNNGLMQRTATLETAATNVTKNMVI